MNVIAWTLAGVSTLVALITLAAGRRAARARARSRAAAPPASPHPDHLRRRAVLDSLPMVAIVLDGRGRVVEANRAALGRFPFLRPDLTLLEAFGDHELAGRVGASIRDVAPAEFTLRLYVDGRRTFRVLSAPYVLGETREALVVLTDTSDATAYQALRSQFVANVSHELKTPLTGLRGLLEALADPEMDPTTRDRFVGRCRDEAERLEALISDILFLSELEATQGMPSSERSHMGGATLAEIDALTAQAARQDVGVVLETGGAGDPDSDLWTPLTERMSRIVARNLVENAIRYAGHGSVARVSVLREADEVVIQVADDGVGIPEQHLPHVFERFYRVDPSRSRSLGGTGLGLSIVKHIAERFGGHATCTAREGFGTTIRVALPAVGPPPPEPLGEPDAARPVAPRPIAR